VRSAECGMIKQASRVAGTDSKRIGPPGWAALRGSEQVSKREKRGGFEVFGPQRVEQLEMEVTGWGTPGLNGQVVNLPRAARIEEDYHPRGYRVRGRACRVDRAGRKTHPEQRQAPSSSAGASPNSSQGAAAARRKRKGLLLAGLAVAVAAGGYFFVPMLRRFPERSLLNLQPLHDHFQKLAGALRQGVDLRGVGRSRQKRRRDVFAAEGHFSS
jgi:hypothetical protein